MEVGIGSVEGEAVQEYDGVCGGGGGWGDDEGWGEAVAESGHFRVWLSCWVIVMGGGGFGRGGMRGRDDAARSR